MEGAVADDDFDDKDVAEDGPLETSRRLIDSCSDTKGNNIVCTTVEPELN